MIRAVVLDFDGVILDTESALLEAYADVYRHHGLSLPAHRLMEETGHAEFSFDPWAGFPQQFDRRALDEARRLASEERFSRLPPMAGVLPLLRQIRALGLSAGIASNSLRPHVEGHLARLGLLEFFPVIAARGEGHQPKPQPDLYLHVLKTLRVSPAEAVAFEDSQTGVKAARSAGLFTIAVPNAATRNHDFGLAHLKLPSLDGFRLGLLVAAEPLPIP